MTLKYIMLSRCTISAGSSLPGRESSTMAAKIYGAMDFFMSFYFPYSYSFSLKNYSTILSTMIRFDNCYAMFFDFTVVSKTWLAHSYKLVLCELRLSISFLRSPLLLS